MDSAIVEVKNKSPFVVPVDDQENPLDLDHIRLDFVDVCLDVKVKGQSKRILNNVTGYVKPGEILYIMGPSGSGKTTLLDYLTDRTRAKPTGKVFLNKKKWTQAEFKKVARYCQQHPLLYECLTVFETLFYAASFYTRSKADAILRVNNTLELLGLTIQRDIKIGGLFYRGISGGQKQRVSVGEQLVANPKLLFLDEPTSGLDSAAAYQLMSKLKEISQKTKLTIVSSIHQPSQRVYDLSDRLLLLAGGQCGGNVVYFGLSDKAQHYFNSINIVNNTSSALAEWMLDQVNGDFGEAKVIEDIVLRYNNSEQKKQTLKELEYTNETDMIEKYKFEGEVTKQMWIKDVWSIFARGIKNNLKNPLVIWIRIAMYAAMAFVLGTIWIGIGDDLKSGDVQNFAGVLFFMAAFLAFMQICILPTYLEDKDIMIKEKTNGCYSLSAYFIGHFWVQLPFTFILALIASIITFFLVEMQNDNGTPFGIFVSNLFVTLVVAEGLIMVVAYMFNHLLICIIISAFAFGTFMVLQGFFIKVSDIPAGWRWLHYVAFHSYSFKNFMVNAFDDITIKKDLNTIPPAMVDYDGKQILKLFDFEDSKIETNFGVLIGMAFAYRLVAFVWSYFRHTGKK